MPDTNQPKPIEGELMEAKTNEAKLAPQGVFIGTLNIMTQPARNFLTEPLAKIYRKKYHGKHKRPKHVFAFDMGLVALGALLAAVSIYFGLIYKPFEAVKINLSLSPKAPVSGGEIVVYLSVENNSNDPINDATAVFKLPAQIKFERASQPFARDTQTVSLGTIDAGTDATVRLVGALSGTVGKNIRVSSNITYKDSAGKTIKKNAAASVKIANGAIGAEFELPNSIVVGQIISGYIRYYNNGNSPVENVFITPAWPENFVLNSSKPAIKNNSWSFGTLEKGSEGKISWSGTIGKSEPDIEFGLETGIKTGADILIQSQSVKTVSVTDPAIKISLDGDDTARLGDTVTIAATYKNNGEHALNNAVVTATADPGLTIKSISHESLGEIAPGATGTVKITAQINSELPEALKASIDPRLTLRASVSGNLDGDSPVAISSPSWQIKIASELGLAAAARYWSNAGDQLGRGPIPLTVGKMTSYWIFWNIKNTTSGISNARVSGTLPENIDFTGKVSAPYGDAPLYNPATRTVTWNASNVPSWPGVTSSAYGAAFEISLVPTADQVGTYPKLVTNQKVTGTDSATGIALTGSAPDITAHLTSDPQAAETGAVR